MPSPGAAQSRLVGLPLRSPGARHCAHMALPRGFPYHDLATEEIAEDYSAQEYAP